MSDSGSITTQAEAKRFFVDKIVAQAVAEAQPLSASERKLLRFSEFTREMSDTPVVAASGEPMSESEYETKVSGLLKRSYKRDVASDSTARATYRHAQLTLAKGDHYLLIMIEHALGPPPSRWVLASGPRGTAARLALFLLLVVPGVIALLLALGIGWGLISHRPLSARQLTEIGPFALFLGFGGAYLIRLWMRERRL